MSIADSASAHRRRVHILLSDKDRESRQDVLGLLRCCSYQVTAVENARQALEILRAGSPAVDLILAEVELPNGKGFKMLKHIMREEGLKQIPIVMMSSRDEMTVVVKCLRLGAADYLVKPLRTNELLNLWTHMWRRRKTLGERYRVSGLNMNDPPHDLLFPDTSESNTGSTDLFSDDTDDRKAAHLSEHGGSLVEGTSAAHDDNHNKRQEDLLQYANLPALELSLKPASSSWRLQEGGGGGGSSVVAARPKEDRAAGRKPSSAQGEGHYESARAERDVACMTLRRGESRTTGCPAGWLSGGGKLAGKWGRQYANLPALELSLKPASSSWRLQEGGGGGGSSVVAARPKEDRAAGRKPSSGFLPPPARGEEARAAGHSSAFLCYAEAGGSGSRYDRSKPGERWSVGTGPPGPPTPVHMEDSPAHRGGCSSATLDFQQQQQQQHEERNSPMRVRGGYQDRQMSGPSDQLTLATPLSEFYGGGGKWEGQGGRRGGAGGEYSTPHPHPHHSHHSHPRHAHVTHAHARGRSRSPGGGGGGGCGGGRHQHQHQQQQQQQQQQQHHHHHYPPQQQQHFELAGSHSHKARFGGSSVEESGRDREREQEQESDYDGRVAAAAAAAKHGMPAMSGSGGGSVGRQAYSGGSGQLDVHSHHHHHSHQHQHNHNHHLPLAPPHHTHHHTHHHQQLQQQQQHENRERYAESSCDVAAEESASRTALPLVEHLSAPEGLRDGHRDRDRRSGDRDRDCLRDGFHDSSNGSAAGSNGNVRDSLMMRGPGSSSGGGSGGGSGVFTESGGKSELSRDYDPHFPGSARWGGAMGPPSSGSQGGGGGHSADSPSGLSRSNAAAYIPNHLALLKYRIPPGMHPEFGEMLPPALPLHLASSPLPPHGPRHMGPGGAALHALPGLPPRPAGLPLAMHPSAVTPQTSFAMFHGGGHEDSSVTMPAGIMGSHHHPMRSHAHGMSNPPPPPHFYASVGPSLSHSSPHLPPHSPHSHSHSMPPPSSQPPWPGLPVPMSVSAVPAAPGQGGVGGDRKLELAERREAALNKFRQKRKDRCFEKKIRYVSRKRLAEQRPRNRGQFVRQTSGGDGAKGEDDDDEEEEDEEFEDDAALAQGSSDVAEA
eukprot:jgi/Mesen1/5109/ME000254S04135